MIRKRMSWVLVWVVVPVMGLVFLGCPKEKPEPPEEIAMDTREVETPTEEMTEPATPPQDQQEMDPLDSEDMRMVNEEAARQGFHPDVHFEFDKSDLTPDAREKLNANARWLREHPQFQIRIDGHCDERGTNEYNLALGERRANTTKDYLTSLGVAAHRMQTISYGEERPVCTESTESCWWRNRRAHMVITGRS